MMTVTAETIISKKEAQRRLSGRMCINHLVTKYVEHMNEGHLQYYYLDDERYITLFAKHPKAQPYVNWFFLVLDIDFLRLPSVYRRVLYRRCTHNALDKDTQDLCESFIGRCWMEDEGAQQCDPDYEPEYDD